MRVVHISFEYGQNNTGGAAVAATRLHLAMLAAGIDSYLFCMQKYEDGPKVIALKEHRAKRLFIKFWYDAFENAFRIVRTRKWEIRKESPPAHIFDLYYMNGVLDQLRPDIVHFHWINRDGLSWRQVMQVKYPVVFHMHDMHLFSTAVGYVWDDRRYIDGFNWRNSKPFELYDVWMKRKMFRRLRPIMIGPSQWICRECEQSVIGHGLKTVMIPNIINSGIHFDRSATRTEKRCVILFGCNFGTRNHYKGWQDLVSALTLLDSVTKKYMVVRVFGETAEPRVEGGVQIEFIGVLKTAEELCIAYNSADIFAMPSRQDNAPTVKFEAWLCGLPVLAFNRQGCAEGIVTKENGWVAPDGDIADYARGIEYFHGVWKSGELDKMHEQITLKASEEFVTDKIVDRYLEVYKSQIEKCEGVK